MECDGGDLEGLVNDLRCTSGVDFAALIVGLPNGDHKVSLRSNQPFKDRKALTVPYWHNHCRHEVEVIRVQQVPDWIYL